MRDVVQASGLGIHDYAKEVRSLQWASILEVMVALNILGVSAKVIVANEVRHIGEPKKSDIIIALQRAHWVILKGTPTIRNSQTEYPRGGMQEPWAWEDQELPDDLPEWARPQDYHLPIQHSMDQVSSILRVASPSAPQNSSSSASSSTRIENVHVTEVAEERVAEYKSEIIMGVTVADCVRECDGDKGEVDPSVPDQEETRQVSLEKSLMFGLRELPPSSAWSGIQSEVVKSILSTSSLGNLSDGTWHRSPSKSLGSCPLGLSKRG